jgi:peptidoglycan/LPS O-acetylase OafA/YrhL
MSIAVSALVKPSRVYRFLTAGAGLALLAAACACVLAGSSRYLLAPLPALALALCGALLLATAARPLKTHRIDISGTG